MNERFDVIIVGAGFCGTMITVHLLKSSERPLSIALVDRSAEFGLGLAYGTSDPQHLLNVVAGRMSAIPDEPEHLLRWLEAEGIEAHFGTFIPRMVYGRYVQHCFAEAVSVAAGRHQLTQICDEAVGVTTEGDGVQVTLAGRVIEAPCAALALGNLPARTPKPFTPSQISAMQFRPPTKRHRSVLIVGSGLTAVDAILSIEKSSPECELLVLSRRGLAPRAHRAPSETPPDLAAMPKPGATLREAVRGLRAVVETLSDVEAQWRMVIDSLRQSTERFWQGFSAEDQKRFLRHVRPFWDVHRHRIPQEVAARLERLRERGKLRYLGGYVDRVAQSDAGFAVTVRHRWSGELERFEVEEILNCTGARFDFDLPLVRNLLANGDAVAVHSQLGLRVDADGALLGSDGNFSRKLFTLGPPCLGDWWESIAVPELGGQAQRLASRLLATIGATPR